MFYSKLDALKLLENQYLYLLTQGKISLDVRIGDIFLKGPQFMTSKSAYGRRRIRFPIEDKLYWVKVAKDSFYRFFYNDESCNSIFQLNLPVHEEELSNELKQHIIEKLCETQQYQAVIVILKYLLENEDFCKITGGILDNTLSPIIKPNGKLELNIIQSFTEKPIFKDNIFNLSLI